MKNTLAASQWYTCRDVRSTQPRCAVEVIKGPLTRVMIGHICMQGKHAYEARGGDLLVYARLYPNCSSAAAYKNVDQVSCSSDCCGPHVLRGTCLKLIGCNPKHKNVGSLPPSETGAEGMFEVHMLSATHADTYCRYCGSRATADQDFSSCIYATFRIM